jgi:hypothetical protein
MGRQGSGSTVGGNGDGDRSPNYTTGTDTVGGTHSRTKSKSLSFKDLLAAEEALSAADTGFWPVETPKAGVGGGGGGGGWAGGNRVRTWSTSSDGTAGGVGFAVGGGEGGHQLQSVGFASKGKGKGQALTLFEIMEAEAAHKEDRIAKAESKSLDLIQLEERALEEIRLLYDPDEETVVSITLVPRKRPRRNGGNGGRNAKVSASPW